MHYAAYHFIKALSISSLTKTKHKVYTTESPGEKDKLEMQDDNNINISLEIDAAADDIEAMASTKSVTFEPEDIGKFLAFVNQVHISFGTI